MEERVAVGELLLVVVRLAVDQELLAPDAQSRRRSAFLEKQGVLKYLKDGHCVQSRMETPRLTASGIDQITDVKNND